MKKTASRYRVRLDRFIGERQAHGTVQAHLVSVIGGDTQIAGIAAAIASHDWFTVDSPGEGSRHVSLGDRAECYRASIQLPAGRPLRHLVALSRELAEMNAGNNLERIILSDDAEDFIWTAVAQIHGVPGRPEWANWIVSELRRAKSVEPLIGIGCSPTLVKGGKGLFMNCVSRGLRSRKLAFPEHNGPVLWPSFPITELLRQTLPRR
jgi:hypothetical protein